RNNLVFSFIVRETRSASHAYGMSALYSLRNSRRRLPRRGGDPDRAIDPAAVAAALDLVRHPAAFPVPARIQPVPPCVVGDRGAAADAERASRRARPATACDPHPDVVAAPR